MNTRQEQNDRIWKALADTTRREILDVLAERPQTTGELVGRFENLSRTNVMKHVDILVRANLIVVRRDGRHRWNYLNPAPIQSVCDRWVGKHVKHMASAMARLKERVEEHERTKLKQSKQIDKPNLNSQKERT